MQANTLRKLYLDFFKSQQHKIAASAPMVVKNDPTLMFTNAGMNQFKDIFLGDSEPKELRLCIQCRRHRQQDQIGAQCAADLKRQC